RKEKNAMEVWWISWGSVVEAHSAAGDIANACAWDNDELGSQVPQASILPRSKRFCFFGSGSFA
ncbi:MAG: hypothetical protein ACOY7J_20700, partial [Pseudomonadota bacterium]